MSATIQDLEFAAKEHRFVEAPAQMAGSNGAVAAAERAFQRKAARDAVATSWS